jgi:hypothetical protein
MNEPVRVAVYTTDRNTRRQVSRALGSGRMTVLHLDSPGQIEIILGQRQAQLLVLDCDNGDAAHAAQILTAVAARPIPVVLLSLDGDKALLELLEGVDVTHLIAKHGAMRVATSVSGKRAPYAVLDERELLVTCEKVLTRDIFGIEKYVGSWGVAFLKATIRSMADKAPFLTDLERYLAQLEVPGSVIPEMLTATEELIINAIVHAPRLPDGTPKYEELGPSRDIVLTASEYVDIAYGCDGQRLMVSVSDRFGTLEKRTLLTYLKRAFAPVVEDKPGGAGLGLSMSMRSIHQLIFNVQKNKRTEAIAGWYLRFQNAQEFRQVGKSLNIFWLSEDAQQLEG